MGGGGMGVTLQSQTWNNNNHKEVFFKGNNSVNNNKDQCQYFLAFLLKKPKNLCIWVEASNTVMSKVVFIKFS